VKRTPDDDAFAVAFGQRLEKAYESAKLRKVTDQAFAETIGVQRPQLRKYFRGEAVPSVRTVALARRHYGINVGYRDIDVGKVLGGRLKRREASSLPLQLRLPFSLNVVDPGKYEVELKAFTARKYELRIRRKEAG
jgi:transcriptional regulator with XRE-family HTH domain